MPYNCLKTVTAISFLPASLQRMKTSTEIKTYVQTDWECFPIAFDMTIVRHWRKYSTHKIVTLLLDEELNDSVKNILISTLMHLQCFNNTACL